MYNNLTTKSNNRISARQSNIELLRIIAMIMIMIFHFVCHGGFEYTDTTMSVNKLWNLFILMFGKIGVDIFVIISGYFLVKSKGFKLSKLLKLWLQLFTYSVGIYIVSSLFGITHFSISKFIMSMSVIVDSKWWFPSTYFILFALSPFINKFLYAIEQKQHLALLIFLTIIWCIIPTFTNKEVQYSDLLWFIYLYMLIGYFRLYDIKTSIKGTRYIIYAIVVAIVAYIIVVCMDMKGIDIFNEGKLTIKLFEMNRLPILLISMFLFLGFLKLDIKTSRIINFVSATTFGIYLIHDNHYSRVILWEKLFKNASYEYSPYLIPYMIGVVAIVFISCMIIEIARTYLIEKRYVKYLDILGNKIENVFNKFINLLLNK